MWEFIQEIHQQGKTIILTTHYLEEAEAMCDEIAIINHGRVVVRDRTSSLLGRLDAKTLVLQLDTAPGALDLPAGVSAETRTDGRLALTYSRTSHSAGALLDAVRKAGGVVADLSTEEPDLEDVFLALTSGK